MLLLLTQKPLAAVAVEVVVAVAVVLPWEEIHSLLAAYLP